MTAESGVELGWYDVNWGPDLVEGTRRTSSVVEEEEDEGDAKDRGGDGHCLFIVVLDLIASATETKGFMATDLDGGEITVLRPRTRQTMLRR